jgi:predicted glycoside hydrolase/deacetylase ChbG (UPF0249 family)
MRTCHENRRRFCAGLGALAASAACATRGAAAGAGGRIRLLVRADDMGATHGINLGNIRAVREGVARSVEVIAPGPWFPEAVRLLAETPGADVGVHLCLTSEWENVKWRPLTHAPSLVDADGFFFPTVRQRGNFPPHTALLDARPKLDEVERELRAQIELVRRHVPRTSHASAHMGAVGFTPELKELTSKLCAEYKLVYEPALKPLPPAAGAADVEARLLAGIEAATPGDYLFVEHPATDDPEMRALAHVGNATVAADRAAVLRAFTSARVKEAIKRRGIELVSYADLARKA